MAQDNFERAIEAVKPLLYKAQVYQEDLVHLYANTGQFESALKQIEILDSCFGYSRSAIKLAVIFINKAKTKRATLTIFENALSQTLTIKKIS